MQGFFPLKLQWLLPLPPPHKQVFCSFISVALVLKNAGLLLTTVEKTEGLAIWGSVCGGTE